MTCCCGIGDAPHPSPTPLPCFIEGAGAGGEVNLPKVADLRGGGTIAMRVVRIERVVRV